MRSGSFASSILVALVLAAGTAAASSACSDTPEAPVDASVTDSAPPVDAERPDVLVPPTDAAEAGACDSVGKDGLANELACTGLYADVTTKALAPGVVAYFPGTPFWSDGAEKSRFVMVPPGQKIDTTDMAAWKWPVGTKTWKEFKVDGKRIETRHYAKVAPNKWARTTYRWDASETRATRFEAGARLADGYEIPTPQKCDTCHFGGADQLLGLDAIALAMPEAKGLTLEGLVAAGTLTSPPAKTRAVFPEDATGKAAAAIQWLHANCAACHNDAPLSAAAQVPLRFALKESEVLGATPTAVSDLSLFTTSYCTASRWVPAGGTAPLKNIVGGDKAASAAFVRANLREPTEKEQMPPIASHKVDATGVALLGAWIDALPPCP
ncbi:MAG: hypothetical protein U0183_04315 [Polyangiaceae bacterium]